NYTLMIGGSRLFATTAPLGTYSGNMSFNIGKNVTVSNEEYSGLNGMNYYTGNITANINGWGNIKIRDNSIISYIANNKYDPTKNTGTLSVTVASGVGNGRTVVGDFNGDGAFTMADTLTGLKAMLNGNGITADNYYGISDINLKNVISLMKKVVK
ncbi:MAG: hypothetical protein IJN48_05975, partial [Clostridia bacterium]|nr:hypothetical protein [Clostridia bacterium]